MVNVDVSLRTIEPLLAFGEVSLDVRVTATHSDTKLPLTPLVLNSCLVHLKDKIHRPQRMSLRVKCFIIRLLEERKKRREAMH